MPQRILASLKSLVNNGKYLIELPFSLHKCPKPSWQGFRPPQNQANAHLILANSSLKKCPKPSGQGSRPPPPYGQCPNARDMNLSGASLRQKVSNVFFVFYVILCFFCNESGKKWSDTAYLRPNDQSIDFVCMMMYGV